MFACLILFQYGHVPFSFYYKLCQLCLLGISGNYFTIWILIFCFDLLFYQPYVTSHNHGTLNRIPYLTATFFLTFAYFFFFFLSFISRTTTVVSTKFSVLANRTPENDLSILVFENSKYCKILVRSSIYNVIMMLKWTLILSSSG